MRCGCVPACDATRPRLTPERFGSVVRLGGEDSNVSFEFEDRAQSMLWPETQDRRLKDPERQLLDAIAAGELDEHLVAIADAVHARRQLLHTVRSARAIAELCVGDRAVVNLGDLGEFVLEVPRPDPIREDHAVTHAQFGDRSGGPDRVK